MNRSDILAACVGLALAAGACAGGAAQGRADLAQVRKCEARAIASDRAGQPLYAKAWRTEEARARKGLGCRDNMDSAGVITAD